jgi:hypothetical protein
MEPQTKYKNNHKLYQLLVPGIISYQYTNTCPKKIEIFHILSSNVAATGTRR